MTAGEGAGFWPSGFPGLCRPTLFSRGGVCELGLWKLRLPGAWLCWRARLRLPTLLWGTGFWGFRVLEQSRRVQSPRMRLGVSQSSRNIGQQGLKFNHLQRSGASTRGRARARRQPQDLLSQKLLQDADALRGKRQVSALPVLVLDTPPHPSPGPVTASGSNSVA